MYPDEKQKKKREKKNKKKTITVHKRGCGKKNNTNNKELTSLVDDEGGQAMTSPAKSDRSSDTERTSTSSTSCENTPNTTTSKRSVCSKRGEPSSSSSLSSKAATTIPNPNLEKLSLANRPLDCTENCPICWEGYKVGEKVCWSKNKQCSHAFHFDCMVTWLVDHDYCPLCRSPYLTTSCSDGCNHGGNSGSSRNTRSNRSGNSGSNRSGGRRPRGGTSTTTGNTIRANAALRESRRTNSTRNRNVGNTRR